MEDEVHGFQTEVESTTAIAELGAGYSFDDPDWLQVIAGGRLFRFATDLEVEAPGPLGSTSSATECSTSTTTAAPGTTASSSTGS